MSNLWGLILKIFAKIINSGILTDSLENFSSLNIPQWVENAPPAGNTSYCLTQYMRFRVIICQRAARDCWTANTWTEQWFHKNINLFASLLFSFKYFVKIFKFYLIFCWSKIRSLYLNLKWRWFMILIYRVHENNWNVLVLVPART